VLSIRGTLALVAAAAAAFEDSASGATVKPVVVF
jgi:hypothetical protein